VTSQSVHPTPVLRSRNGEHSQPIRAELGRSTAVYMREQFGERLAGPGIPHPRITDRIFTVIVSTGRDHAQPVRAELGIHRGFFVPERFGERLARLGIPHPRRAIRRRGEHAQPSRLNWAEPTLPSCRRGSMSGLPSGIQPRRVVRGRGDHPHSIRAEPGREDLFFMPKRFGERLAALGIPHPRVSARHASRISTCRDHAHSIRAEVGRVKTAFMPEWFGEQLAGLGIPHPRRVVPASCDHSQPSGLNWAELTASSCGIDTRGRLKLRYVSLPAAFRCQAVRRVTRQHTGKTGTARMNH